MHETDNEIENETENTRDKLRMIEWLLVAALLLGSAGLMLLLGIRGPYQTLVWKLGLVTLGGFVGYRLDRAAYRDRITLNSPPPIMIRRAIIMAACIGGLALGV
ncbi:hypothetical protein [Herbaspirillum sp. ST 5-3]|uniref:hypothetical protein n=1 Tax=Oxalobacteraceae TaxID=75682 RepID=UPI001455DBCD|nr:hypothetical protein [Herbaspirillum sp. ST 5-3]